MSVRSVPDRHRLAANTAMFSGSLPAKVAAVKAAGFGALELWSRDCADYPAGATGIAELMRQAGLDVPAFQLLRDYEGGPASRMSRLAEVENLLSEMQELGADLLLLCANTSAESSGNSQDQIADLRSLADMAAARGMRIGFEPLAWSRWINDYESAWACVEAVNHAAFGLVIDSFHYFRRGSPLELIDGIAMERLFLVQLNNAPDLPLPSIQIARHHRQFPQDGIWPVGELVRRLEMAGYAGTYSLEVFNDAFLKRDPQELACEAFASLEQLFIAEEAPTEA